MYFESIKEPDLLYANRLPEIPLLVIHVDRSHIVGRERHILVAANLDDETLAGDHLVEILAVFERNRNHLVAHAGFALPLEMIREFTWDRNQMLLHHLNLRLGSLERNSLAGQS